MEEDKKLKPFDQIYMSMIETKQRNMRVGYGIDEETGLSLRSPRDHLTPRGGNNITPRSYLQSLKSTTPRSFRGANEPTTPSGASGTDSTASTNPLKNDEIPQEEFSDYLTNLDKNI